MIRSSLRDDEIMHKPQPSAKDTTHMFHTFATAPKSLGALPAPSTNAEALIHRANIRAPAPSIATDHITTRLDSMSVHLSQSTQAPDNDTTTRADEEYA